MHQSMIARHSGFSLIELTVALVVTSILLVAIGSAMVIASHALPSGESRTTAAIEAGDALARFSTELQHALHLVAHNQTSVTFTVADRNGDGSSERLRYAWSGQAGDPLTRQLNHEPAVAVVHEVEQFTLGYHTEEQRISYSGPPVEGAEQVVMSFDETSGVSLKLLSIGPQDWIGQYATPNLPADALWWRPTRVRFRAKSLLSLGGYVYAQVRRPSTDHLPTDLVLTENAISLGLLGGLDTWDEVSFNHRPTITPGSPVSLVLRTGGGISLLPEVEYADGTIEGNLAVTNDGGGQWQLENQRTLVYYLYGLVTVPGPAQQFNRRFYTAVDAHLRTAAPADTTMDTQIALLNRPEAARAFWRLDFERDPTALDLDADQEPDWAVEGGSTFNGAALTGGIWHAGQTLLAQPMNTLVTPMRTRLRMRHSSADGGAAAAWFHVDRTDGMIGTVMVSVQRQADATQTLTLYTQTSGGAQQALVEVPGLPAGLVDVRLLMDPGPNTVHLRVNDMDRGTYLYILRSATAGNGAVALDYSGSSAEYDYFEMQVLDP